jgi:hypothetical protein
MIHGETLHSVLPWDIPWFMPDHAVFLSVLYMVLGILGMAVGFAAAKAFIETLAEPPGAHGHH